MDKDHMVVQMEEVADKALLLLLHAQTVLKDFVSVHHLSNVWKPLKCAHKGLERNANHKHSVYGCEYLLRSRVSVFLHSRLNGWQIFSTPAPNCQ